MYHARDLAAMDVDQLWNLPDGPMKVIFDDGVLETTKRATVYSAYLWGLYVLYPKTPACMGHHLGDRRMTGDTHLDILGKVQFDCYDTYAALGQPIEMEELNLSTYRQTNRLYNDFTYRLEAYVQSLNILDFMEVIFHPAIKKANDEVKPTRRSIAHVHSVIEKVLLDPKELVGNPVATAAKNGVVRLEQLTQSVGPRGYVTDVDSNIFPDPITVGYVHGIRSLADSMKESRSAAKSLTFTEEPLQKVEYFNRRLQLLAHTLATMYSGDCGSQTYLNWRVRSIDLKHLLGKYYLTDQGLRYIKASDRHLIGEMIQIRTVLHCIHPDPNGVCATCFGDLALSIPKDTNVGHVSATALCAEASQQVLSVKHLDMNAAVDAIELSEFDQQYIKIGTDANTILLANRLENHRVVLTINAKEAPHISDVQFVDDVKNLQITFISTLTEVGMTVTGKGGEIPVMIPVAVGSRQSSMSHELLDYLKHHSWELTPQGGYRIDLSNWDTELPLFVLPLKQLNMLEYMSTIDTFLKGVALGGSVKSLKDFTSSESALMEFYSLVTSRLFVNIAHLEVLVKVAMIRSERHRDYRIPVEGNAVEFGQFNTTMDMRSLGGAMAFEQHKRLFNNPVSYLVRNRPDHILDALLKG